MSDGGINGERRRLASSAADLLFYTDTNVSDPYPIFVTSDGEVWLKAKPHRVDQGQRVYDVPVAATFFVQSVEKNDSADHELLKEAVEAVKAVTRDIPDVIKKTVRYEVYSGDMESLLGEATGIVVKVVSRVPYSGISGYAKRAWAIGYDLKKRLSAKYPQLSRYVYIDGHENDLKRRATVWLVVKLVKASSELEELFGRAVRVCAKPVDTEVSLIEAELARLKKEIEEKEAELANLKEKYNALLMKLNLEKMKAALTG